MESLGNRSTYVHDLSLDEGQCSFLSFGESTVVPCESSQSSDPPPSASAVVCELNVFSSWLFNLFISSKIVDSISAKIKNS